MVEDAVLREIWKVADEFGFEAAALAAIAEVESGGRAFAMVDGRAEPMIRFGRGRRVSPRRGPARWRTPRRKRRGGGWSAVPAGSTAGRLMNRSPGGSVR